eukprot:1319896-Amphidinium_carterae.1
MADAWFHSVQDGPVPTLRRAYVDDFMLYVHGESMAEVVRTTSSLHQSLTRWLNAMAVEVNNKTHLAASSEVLLKKLRQADHGSMRDYSNAAETPNGHTWGSIPTSPGKSQKTLGVQLLQA